MQLTQSSTAKLNIKVPVIDKTKRWEIGIGSSKNGGMDEALLKRIDEIKDSLIEYQKRDIPWE